MSRFARSDAPDLLAWLDAEMEIQARRNAAGFDREAALLELRSLAYREAADRQLVTVTLDDLETETDPEQRARLRSVLLRVARDNEEDS